MTAILCLSQLSSQSQNFNDTLISVEDDTIICKIGLINNYNIFYQFNSKKKKIVSSYMARNMVKYYSTPASDVTVLELEIPTNQEATSTPQFAEENGIIYSSSISQPPRFHNGINDLYSYLERTIIVRPIDNRTFRLNYVTVL